MSKVEIKSKDKIEAISTFRERISSSAKHRLESFFDSIQQPTRKMVDRWERKAEKDREKAILKYQDEIYRKILAREASIPPLGAYHRDVERVAPPVVEEKPPAQPNYDNWMHSDGHGEVLGDRENQEMPFRNVWRIYGRNKR